MCSDAGASNNFMLIFRCFKIKTNQASSSTVFHVAYVNFQFYVLNICTENEKTRKKFVHLIVRVKTSYMTRKFTFQINDNVCELALDEVSTLDWNQFHFTV